MKYIEKQAEPVEFTTWKEQEIEDLPPLPYRELAGVPKIALHTALRTEQGNICCYCGTMINADNSHIEHLKPRKKYPEDQLNYENLLASCQRHREKRKPQHCGVLKDNWYDEDLFVSPLDIGCEERFRFTEFGEIYPADENDKGASVTINKMGLNIAKLEALRRKAIEPFTDPEVMTDADEVNAVVESLKQRDQEGNFHPFCFAIIHVLQQ